MSAAAKEIGGYLELERFPGMPYHEGAVALNSGRGCLAYLAELRGIRAMWVPDYMCGCVPAYLSKIGVEVLTYRVGEGMLPDYRSLEISDGEWMLLADYYGQLREGDVARALDTSGGRLVVDETQGFFREPWKGADTFYTCRKWFGVADGAYLATSDGARLGRELPRDESHARMGFVLGRFERSASEFYAEASENNDFFASEPAKLMSPITENLLRAIDYEAVKSMRNANWDVLEDAFSGVNKLDLRKPDGAFMYPLMVEGAKEMRRQMIAESVYIPCLWPDTADSAELPRRLSEGILPLPVDQRYGAHDMARVAEAVLGLTGKGAV